MQRNDGGDRSRDRGRKEKGDTPICRLSLSGACVFTPPPAAQKSPNENTT